MNKDQELRLTFIKQVLSDIINVSELNQDLIFKWGTSLMLFHNLNRFSEDLDFNYTNNRALIKLEDCLNEKGYTYESKKQKFGKTYNITYIENNKDYNCIVDLASYNYKTKPDFKIKNFNWKPLKVLNLEHNFAHKLCAFYERKKGRDVVDIHFYLWKGVYPNEDILQERHWRNFSEFCSIVLKELQTPYLNGRLDKALDQLHYENIDREEFKIQIIDNINKNYKVDNISINLQFKDQLKQWDTIINLSDNEILLVDGSIMNKDIKSKFAVLSKKDSKILYQAKTEEKIFQYFNEEIISKNLNIKKKIWWVVKFNI